MISQSYNLVVSVLDFCRRTDFSYSHYILCLCPSGDLADGECHCGDHNHHGRKSQVKCDHFGQEILLKYFH